MKSNIEMSERNSALFPDMRSELLDRKIPIRLISSKHGVPPYVLYHYRKHLSLNASYKPHNRNREVGNRYGSYTVVSFDNSNEGRLKYICRCDCGTTKSVFLSNLRNGYTKSCRRCGINSRGGHHNWKGHGEISGQRWYHICRLARMQTEPMSITLQHIWELFLSQDRRCALSRLPISFAKHWGMAWTASLDRIDSSRGYVIGNVQWLHADVNRMKTDLPQSRFLQLVKLIAENVK